MGRVLSTVFLALSPERAVAVASRFRNLLDEKFTLDGIWIQSTLHIPDASLDSADPFRNTAFVYRVLGLADKPDIAAMAADRGVRPRASRGDPLE